MAVTVAGKNYSLISSCDTATAGGTWSSTPTPDSANFKYSAASLSEIQKVSGLNTQTFTPTSSIDMSGTKHLRFWFICSSLGLLDIEANGGIRVGVSDGTNTGYWYLGGKDTYAGGWINLCVDVSSSVDSGTKPTAMNAITSIDFVINQTAGGKNVDNVWIDHICLCDGLIVSGDDAASYFDFDNIFTADNATTLAIGIIRKIGGVFYLVGSIEWGAAAATTKFKALSQVVVFEDRPVNANLYAFDIIDDGTNTTEFILGDKVGTAGIQGCTIRVEDVTQTPKFDIDGKTDTDVDNFKLYGSTFYGADALAFAAAATEVEVLSCNFEQCGQIDPNTAEVRSCFFINTSDADSAILWNESIDVENCGFIGNTTGAGIEHPSAAGTPYTYTNMVFSGNTYDVLNSSGSSITINNTGTSNGSSSEGSSVTFKTTKTVALHVQDVTQTAIQDVQVSIDKSTQDVYTSTSGNSQGDLDFVVSEALALDVMTAGWIDVHDVSTGKQHSYRYSSVDSGTKTFALRTKVSGTAEAGGSTTLLVDTGIGAMDVMEGDTIRNETAGSWATVLKVETNQVTTTVLSSGTWAIGQTWSVHSLAVLYTTSDKVKTPIMNQDSDVSGDASIDFNYQSPRDIVIKARKSAADDNPRYQAFSDTGQIGPNGYTLTITLKEQPIPI